MFGGLGMWEVLLIFLVVLLLFGAKRLPEIGSSLGKGIREFKGSLREIESELKVPEDDKPSRKPRESRPAEPRDEPEEPRRLTSSDASSAPLSGREKEPVQPVEAETPHSTEAEEIEKEG